MPGVIRWKVNARSPGWAVRGNAPLLPGGGWAQLELTDALLAYEQAPKWGKENSTSRASGARYGGLDFCLRPIPHLGACSQPWPIIRMAEVKLLILLIRLGFGG